MTQSVTDLDDGNVVSDFEGIRDNFERLFKSLETAVNAAKGEGILIEDSVFAYLTQLRGNLRGLAGHIELYRLSRLSPAESGISHDITGTALKRIGRTSDLLSFMLADAYDALPQNVKDSIDKRAKFELLLKHRPDYKTALYASDILGAFDSFV